MKTTQLYNFVEVANHLIAWYQGEVQEEGSTYVRY
jgi:hypothetical protein